MSLKKKPVYGMRDSLPGEVELRDYVTGVIKETYRSYGFTPIETPCMEDINNLLSKQGGENEKLIFKILKRGEKLNLEEASEENDLTDMGMRYDLTLPLSRYYSNNKNDLITPFKALQVGPVWRADRPQRGRYRQLVQCDIDILGDPTNAAEKELILATSETLSKLSFKGFIIRINERRILKAMASYSGFSEEDFDRIFISLDKMDKIGISGVKEELLSYGFSEENTDKYLGLYEQLTDLSDVKTGLLKLKELIGDHLPDDIKDSLIDIEDTVNAVKTADFTLVFDPTLVRGMSYYTGTIFEVSIPEFSGSCGGGGRYDKMIGRFTGTDTPACGFSIGFERIILLLSESGFKIPGSGKKTAFLYDKRLDNDKLKDVMKEAALLRKKGETVLVVKMNKNKKFQKEQLIKEGYTDFKEFF